ncbi:MAG: RDD family protein [Chloroflexi bacterium]|nr:RDD family protein [Chloroflexota bacterium]
MNCKLCGRSNTSDAAFCQGCGSALTGEPSGPAIAATTPPPVATVAPASAQPRSVAYAGFWRRFVAYIIDYLITSIAANIIFFLPLLAILGRDQAQSLGWLDPFSQAMDMLPPMRILAVFGAAFVIDIIGIWLYHALMESSRLQATVGKLAIGIQVTDANGNRITFARATGRFFSKLISGITLFIGFFMAGFTSKKQALHDIIADTLVIIKPQ